MDMMQVNMGNAGHREALFYCSGNFSARLRLFGGTLSFKYLPKAGEMTRLIKLLFLQA